MSDSGNPYSAPPDESPVPQIATPSNDSLSLGQQLQRQSFSVIVVVVFAASGYFAFRHLQLRNYVIAFSSACLSLMCIPFVDHSSTMRERFFASLIMPIAMAGLAGSVLLYFWMFQFAWFEAIFNDKGSGPVGLILSALSGLVSGGLLGWQMLRRLGMSGSTHHSSS